MILSIETSTKVCSVALHNKELLIASQSYHLEKSHSSLLPGIINEILKNADVKKKDLMAVSVSAGPGSYTGLRIGVSVAKGLAFGLGIPLISASTLEIMARSVVGISQGTLVIPMIDARRMEVYTATYDHLYQCIDPVAPLIIEEKSFSRYDEIKLLLVGNGAAKCDIIEHPNYEILDFVFPDARYMGGLSWNRFIKQDFENPAYFEPMYLKEFQTKKAKNRLIQ